MYAYRNHNQVHSIEVNLNTCDNDVAATSFQSCCTSSSDRNLSTAHLEYIDWIKEIIAVCPLLFVDSCKYSGGSDYNKMC
jgi:hypothetical protein